MTRSEANRLFLLAVARDLEQNEWYDGEDDFQRGARSRILREFRENAPSRVTIAHYGGNRNVTHRYFPTRLEAEAWLEQEAASWNDWSLYATIIPVTRVPEGDRGFIPPQYVTTR